MNFALPAWLAVGAVSVGAVGFAGHMASSAHAAAAAASSELARTADQARQLLVIRAASSSPAAKRASSGLAQRVTASLSRAGLPASALSSLSPEAQSVQVDGDTHVKRQRATLVLASLTLPQLGAFLDAWRTAEPDWNVSSIDLSPAAPGGAPPGASTGGDLPLRSVLTLESVSIEETPASYPFVRTSTEGAR